MARRRRRSITGRLALAVGLVLGLRWLWSQPWATTLLGVLAAVTVGAVIGWAAVAARRRRRRRRRLATLDGLLDLTPLQFEHEVAQLLRSLGFTAVDVCGGASDLQADIVATDPDGLATIVQCKRYAADRTIGSPVIQSFIGMARIHHDCERAIFVTTASFTAPACRLADEHDVELIDGDGLVELFTHGAAVLV